MQGRLDKVTFAALRCMVPFVLWSVCVKVHEGTWQGHLVAVKVLDGVAAASQKAMREVGHTTQ